MMRNCPPFLRFVFPAMLLGGVSLGSLCAQQSTNAAATPTPAPLPAGATNGNGPAPTSAAQPSAPADKAAAEMTAEMQKLKEEGKLTSTRALSNAVRKVVRENSIQHDIPAPMGAKVIAVHKHPGDQVHIGDKIVTLLVNGKEVPILAKQNGIMQTINVSKGGVIGNSRPRAAKSGHETGSILLTLRPLRA